MWPVYLALKQLFPSGKRASAFFLLSVSGVMLGVALLVVVQGVMGGFGNIYREIMVDLEGHVTITPADGRPLRHYDNLVEHLEDLPEVQVVSPYALGQVGVVYGNRPGFPRVRGVDLSREEQVIRFDDYLKVGDLDDLDDERVFLSSNFAASLGIRGEAVGEWVEVYSPLMISLLSSDEVLLPNELEIAGIFETGWNEADLNTIVVSLRRMQELYELGDSIHGISIRLHDDIDEFAFADQLRASLEAEPLTFQPIRVRTWMAVFESFLWVLELEKTMLLFLLLFVVLVASFAIMNSQLMTVLRKTREMGVLAALGARPRALLVCFLFQSVFIGIIGLILGYAMAFTFIAFRSEIIFGLASLLGRTDVLIQYYQFAELPIHFIPRDFIVITVATLVLTALAGLLPAWRAARMKPAEALRVET